jgi:putative transposase
MPWTRMHAGEERVKFVVRMASGEETMAALCRAFGVSRSDGYRWRNPERSRRETPISPRGIPNQAL